MTLIPWPKTIKLADVVDAVDDLAEQVALNAQRIEANNQRITTLEAKYDAVVLERGNRIGVLEHDLHEHQVGALVREQEIDRLQAEVKRQAWYARTGRKP